MLFLKQMLTVARILGKPKLNDKPELFFERTIF